MDINKAALLTWNVAYLQMNNWREPPCHEMSFAHIESMWLRWPTLTSDTKKCRWLGWMQATIVAMTFPHVGLEVMKNINKECSDA